MKNRRNRKTARKDQGLLVSVAKTIGSTLGSVVAKAEGLSKPPGRRTKSAKSRATRSRAVKARNKSMA
jgi:hypothetical protein